MKAPLSYTGCLAAAVGLLLVDRITKQWALSLHQPWHYNQFLSYAVSFNRGINFGLFYSESSLVFYALTSLIALVMCGVAVAGIAAWRQKKSLLAYTLILSGALSNLYDRLLYGGVIDFIILSYKKYQWPAFNAADIAIVTGVLLLLYQRLRDD